MAAGIDRATLTVLPGRTHIPFAGDSHSVLNAMRRGLGLPALLPGAPPRLTSRQTQVAALVARGWSNRQISEELVISEKTVERHRANILEKLGMRDRVELTRYAIRRGLIEP